MLVVRGDAGDHVDLHKKCLAGVLRDLKWLARSKIAKTYISESFRAVRVLQQCRRKADIGKKRATFILRNDWCSRLQRSCSRTTVSMQDTISTSCIPTALVRPSPFVGHSSGSFRTELGSLIHGDHVWALRDDRDSRITIAR
jgi:hypothetical protein